MLLSLLIFIVLSAAWFLVLWFGFALDVSQWSTLGLLVLHILPPVVASLSWWLWRRRVKLRNAREAQERESQAQAARLAALEAAHAQHAQELEQRQFACACRVVAITGMTTHKPLDVVSDPSVLINAVTIQEVQEMQALGDLTLFDVLASSIQVALRHVYESCAAAAAMPIYLVQPESELPIEVARRVREMHTQLVRELSLAIQPDPSIPAVLFLPNTGSPSDSIIGLFESAQDLPGAVIVAFDSPLLQERMLRENGDVTNEDDVTEDDVPFGLPSQGVFAMFVTNPSLDAMLEKIAGRRIVDESQHDSLTPFWEKSEKLTGKLALLGLVSPAMRDALGALPIIAHIHRAAVGQASKEKGRVVELTRQFTALLDRAHVNAALMDAHFVADDIKQEAQQDAQADKIKPESRCAWLVHNAGHTTGIGPWLSAMGGALMYFESDLNPTVMATNVVSKIGNLGCATPVGVLAMALAYAHEKKGPVLCAQLSAPDAVALSFVVPV